jgi:hypothetical protein
VVVVWGALISASSLLVRQHYIIDVVVSVPLADLTPQRGDTYS